MNFTGKYRSTLLALAITGLSVFSAAAGAVGITAVPTAWKLQSYGGNPVLWYTGSSCPSGQLLPDPSWSQDQMKLLWATVMTAKASQLPVNVNYTVNGSSCILTDFSLDAQ